MALPATEIPNQARVDLRPLLPELANLLPNLSQRDKLRTIF